MNEKQIYVDRIAALRELMVREGIDAYIIYTADPHLSEYIPEYWQVRTYISGFTGSVGTLVITSTFAGLWVDSRYWVMAEKQLAGTGIELQKLADAGSDYLSWLIKELPRHSRIAFDGQTISATQGGRLQSLAQQHAWHIDSDKDFISEIWSARPSLPAQAVYEHSTEFCDRTKEDKLKLVRQSMAEKNTDWHILSSLDDIAWLLNLRGSDVAYNPVFLAHMLVGKSSAYLFIDSNKLNEDLASNLEKAGIKIRPYTEFYQALAGLGNEQTVLADKNKITLKSLQNIPEGSTVINDINPSSLLKSCKSDFEINHIKQTMVEDGVALCEFFAWFEEVQKEGKPVSELTVDEKLIEYRSKRQHYVSPSFATIAGFNANGAMPHYCATVEDYAMIEGDGLLLIDSGGQYESGTTDITRVVGIGKVSAAQKRDYTLVLKSHIAIASMVAPQNIPGQLIDTVGRAPLWKEGIDFGHGTGHGVGYFLNVHEGPQVISYKSPIHSHSAMKIGMVTSNEPGVYRPEKWGVRLENLMATRSYEDPENQAFGEFIHFETLTLCPFDLNCINSSLLTQDEKNWLNEYHEKVRQRLSDKLTLRALQWLRKNTGRLS